MLHIRRGRFPGWETKASPSLPSHAFGGTVTHAPWWCSLDEKPSAGGTRRYTHHHRLAPEKDPETRTCEIRLITQNESEQGGHGAQDNKKNKTKRASGQLNGLALRAYECAGYIPARQRLRKMRHLPSSPCVQPTEVVRHLLS
ncbi:hypothetical protein MRX96_021452 [Rhipicephalus microplus]